MKFNISYPVTGAQKCFEIDDVKKFSIFFDRRMGQEVEIDTLGDDFKGYVVKITGGNDKDGFTMKQGVLCKGRVRILMSKGHKSYRPRRTGERKRKSCRGCIVGADISVLSLAIVKKGEKDIDGLTNNQVPRRLGPKRVAHIRKLYALKKEEKELVAKSVIRRKWQKKVGEKEKTRQKAPKIQRLVTAVRLRRKRIYKTTKVQRWRDQIKAKEDYHKMIVELKKKAHDKKTEAKKQREQQGKGEKKVDEKKPADKKVDDKKQDKKQQDKKPVDKKQADKKPEQKSTDKKPVEKKPAEKKPAEKKAEPKKEQPKKGAEKK